MMFLHVLLLFCAFPPSAAEGRLRQFYRLNQKPNVTTAESLCRVNYTDLVTVYDQQENVKLLQLLNNSFPSGWIGAYRGNYSLKWSNGDDVTYNRSSPSYSDQTRCAAMNASGDWESLLCTETKYFMCYKQDGAGGTPYIYTLIPQNKTWSDAQLYCRENHTDLVSIRNEEENILVKNNGSQSSTPFWIGLLSDSVDWRDGGRSAYRNWSQEVDQSRPNAFTSVPYGRWLRASTNNNYPLCYKSFIHVSPAEMSWEAAMDYCSTQFSGALCLQSENDQTETQRELNRNNISAPVWVGLRKSRLFGFWIWINGLQVGNWTNWKGGKAPEAALSQHCAALQKMNRQYTLTDKDCRSTFRVVCETK